MKRFFSLAVALLLLLSLISCGDGGDASESTSGTSPETTAEETTTGELVHVTETRAAYDRWLPYEYEEDNRGLLLRAEFPQGKYEAGMDIEGTVLLKNTTDAPLNAYLYLSVDIASYPAVMGDGGLPDEPLTFAGTRETYVTTGNSNSELLPVILSAGEEITVDFTILGDESLFAPDIETFYFSIVLCENETFRSGGILYGFYIPIPCRYV